MKTLTTDDFLPFDIRTCPIWAIPTLGWMSSRPGFAILAFNVDKESQGTAIACGTVYVHIEDEGVYSGLLYKASMGQRSMPALYNY